jgi:predicted phosphoribosyltransferase
MHFGRVAGIIAFFRSRLNSDTRLSTFVVKFQDRTHAGNLLAEKLAEEPRVEQTIVLGIPRGGVILADIVATRLGADFDIVIPRKLGAPDNEELAIGAVMSDGTSYLNRYLINALRISDEYLEKEKQRQIGEIGRRSLAYRRKAAPYGIKGKRTILVDDGIATGATVIASARWVRKQAPSHLTIAVPVAPTQSADILEEEADSVVALLKSRDFGAVGQFYEKFDPVSDDQVQAIMRSRGLL